MGARRCPYEHGTFRAMRWADGPIWIACPACRRYIELPMTPDVAERMVARTSFTCSRCGGPGHMVGDDPATKGYRLDARDGAAPRRRPKPATPKYVEPTPPHWRPVF